MNMQTYTATHYRGKPAVFDTVARIYYYGFRDMQAARDKADELNKPQKRAGLTGGLDKLQQGR